MVALRLLFVGLASSVWFILVVLSFIAPYRTTDSLPAWVVSVIGLGILCGWRIRALEGRLLRARNDVELMLGFRATFFIQLGLAQLPSLVAFVGSFIASTVWVYVVGAAVTTIDLWLMAPSRRNVIRIQDRLKGSGIPASLGRILTTRGEAGG
jgi:hypothetical protein